MADPAALDAFVGHRIGIERYGSEVARKIDALLTPLQLEIELRLRRDLDKIDERGQLSPSMRKRLEETLKTIRDLQRETHAVMQKELITDLQELADYEAEWARVFYGQGLGVGLSLGRPTASYLNSIITSQPLNGRHLKSWMASLEAVHIENIAQQIRIGMVAGESINEIVARLRGTSKMAGKDGQLWKNRKSAEALVRTAVNHTANQAHMAMLTLDPGIFPKYRWVSVLDARTTQICRALDSRVFLTGEGPVPPAHVNCLPADAAVATCGLVTGASERWFDGDLVVIRTAGGYELACTPNHPVLTDLGWLPAQALNLSHRVFNDGSGHRPRSRLYGEREDTPALAHQVAVALLNSSKMASAPVKPAAVDFHGDGGGSDIAVVGSDRQLRRHLDAALTQRLRNRPLESRARLARQGASTMLLEAYGASSRAAVGGSCDGEALVFAQAAHPGKLLLAAISGHEAVGAQDPLYGTWADAEALRYAMNTSPSQEALDDLRIVETLNRATMNGVAALAQPIVHGAIVDAVMPGNRGRWLTPKVALDDVVYVGRRQFSGHVYNLETADGLIVANGIVTHNCRSTILGIPRGSEDIDMPTYEDWLRRQDAKVVKEILGATRAKLFLEGKLPVKAFSNRDGDALNLDEIRKREGAIWQRVIGDPDAGLTQGVGGASRGKSNAGSRAGSSSGGSRGGGRRR